MAIIKLENSYELNNALNNAKTILEFYKNNEYDYDQFAFLFKSLEHDISHLQTLEAMFNYADEINIDTKDFELLGKYK